MARTRMRDRRESTTIRFTWTQASGATKEVLCTVGVEGGKVLEVFCSDFKVGSDHFAIITDACIVLSRLLQHGDSPADILASMCQPPSLLGHLAAAVAVEQERVNQEAGA